MATQPGDSPRKAPRQARARATVDAILLAAAHILKTEGPERATTNRIAALAGVSIGSLYQYFANKDAVFAALRERHGRYYDSEVRTGIEEAQGRELRDAAERMLRRMVLLHAEDVSLHTHLCREARAIAPEEETAYRRLVQEYLEQNAEELRPLPDPELTAFIIARALECLIHEVALESPERLRHADYVAELTELLVRFVAPGDRCLPRRGTPEADPPSLRQPIRPSRE